jgi:hypothetical protein
LVATTIGAFQALGSIDFNNQAMINVDINSGAIDGTTIGAASKSAGSFTDIKLTGSLEFDGAGATPTAFSGADATIITGTKGTNGDFAIWNGDGDIVDGPTPSDYILKSLADAANDFLIASGDNTFVKKTLAETVQIVEDQFVDVVASTSFTVGGTAITDNTITDDGQLVINTISGVNIFKSGGGGATGLSIGQDDVQSGILTLYGHATGSSGGGQLNMYLSDDNNTDIIAYQMGADNDDFYLGPNTNTTAFQLIGAVAAVTAKFNVALDVDAACTATTFTADTNLTVDGLVLTADTITNDAALTISAPGNVTLPEGDLRLGADDSQKAELRLYGNAAAGNAGIYLYNGANTDGAVQYYHVLADGSGYFQITDDATKKIFTANPDGATSLYYNDNLAAITNVTNGITSQNNFTVGDTAITDGVITDGTGLQLAANVNVTGTFNFDAGQAVDAIQTTISDVDDELPTGGAVVDYVGTQNHTRLHAMTDTSDHEAGNYVVFYTNGSQEILELALGADTKVLTSGGEAAAPTWETPSTAGVEDDAYGAGWEDDTTNAASQNALFDKIDAMDGTISTNTGHLSADGSSHSFLDQAVTIAGTPTFGTVDVTTDFTVGGTVITDGTITDNGQFYIDAATALYVTGSGNMYLGVEDGTDYGNLHLRADGTAATQGGVLSIDTAEAHDTHQSTYMIQAEENDLLFGHSGDADVMKFIGNDGSAAVTVQFSVDTDVNAAFSATTLDADTNFTVGDTIITDGAITDATDLILDANIDVTGTHGASTYTADTSFTIGDTAITDGVITDGTGLSLTADVTITGDLTMSDDKRQIWDTLPSTDDTASGMISSETVDDAGSAIGDILFLESDGHWDRADASAVATCGLLGMALEAANGTKEVMHDGWIQINGHGFTIGAQLYVSTTEGDMTNTAPSGDGEIVQVIGYATSADVIRFKPSSDYLEIVVV